MVSFLSGIIKPAYSFTAALAVLFMLGCSEQTGDHANGEQAETTAGPATPTRTVKAVMVEEIEPASNILWAAALDENIPQTDADWKLLEQAAEQLLAGAHTIKTGGSGPNETLWAQQPEWKNNNQRLIEIETVMLNSVHNKDYDGLLESGFVLIEPCGACHTAFTVEASQ